MSDKPSTDSKPRPPQFPARGEPIRVKTLTLDASQAVAIPGLVVNTITYDPGHPLNANWEVWFLPQLNHFWVKNHSKKHERSEPVLVHAARVSQWIVYQD